MSIRDNKSTDGIVIRTTNNTHIFVICVCMYVLYVRVFHFQSFLFAFGIFVGNLQPVFTCRLLAFTVSNKSGFPRPGFISRLYRNNFPPGGVKRRKFAGNTNLLSLLLNHSLFLSLPHAKRPASGESERE